MVFSFRRTIRLYVQFVALFAISTSMAFATTVTIPAGTGTLTFTRTSTTKSERCFVNGRWINVNLTTYNYSGFSYKDSSSTVTSLTGTDFYIIDGCDSGNSGGASVALKSTMLDVVYDNSNDIVGSVTGFNPHGYVNPKYVILGVTYAPPGPSSYVNYTNSTTVSSTTDEKSTFATQFEQSLKTNVGVTIKGWSAGLTTTSTSSYTQSSFTSSSVTVSKTTSLSNQTPGPSNAYAGLNHDYDIVWLWLNPVQLFTLIEDTGYHVKNVEWDGYGFSTLDQNSMDVYPVYVGWLNGDIAMTTDQVKPLQRAWAAGESWPAGKGPALTSADYQAIVKADEYWQCTSLPSACPTTVDGTRFTQTPLNQDLIYVQAPVGGQPLTQTYTDGYTQSSTQGHGASYSYAQTFASETTFSGSLFKLHFGSTLTLSNTITSTNAWDQSLTNSNTQTATASITGPPCVVSGSTCNPVYNGSTQFGLYEDNLFGTFMFFPLN